MTMQGAIHVRELDTSAGSMFEGVCAWHGSMLATFDQEEAMDRAGIHAARMHGTRMLDLEVHYLQRGSGAPKGLGQ